MLALALALCAAFAVAACSSESGPRRQQRAPAPTHRDSGPPRTLRSRAQASRFLASVARAGNAEEWRLAAGASVVAQRVWSERVAVEDLGARIRRAGGEWACELAAGSYRVGHVGVFSVGDRESLARDARASGASAGQIQALFADIMKMRMSDVRGATAAVCQYPDFDY